MTVPKTTAAAARTKPSLVAKPSTAPRASVRKVAKGDTAPSTEPKALEKFVTAQATEAAQNRAVVAAFTLLEPNATGTPADRAKRLRAMFEGASADDQKVLREALLGVGKAMDKKINPDEVLAGDWRDGGYPYKNLMRRSSYEKEKFRLQVELLKLQAWAKETGQRIVILFEGRDAAGKGGAIKRFMEHMNPRGARVVALEKPTPLEQGQWYFQR